MAQDRIIPVSNETIQAHFAEMVHHVVADRRVVITDEAQFYVVNLLCEFALTDRLYDWDQDTQTLERDALALMLARAATAPLAERVKLLKKLGDSSLYVSGFFAESLARSLVDVDYYISMGGSAYGTLSDTLRERRRSGQFSELYAELAGKFRDLVNVLALVSEQSTGMCSSNASLMKLYDLWVRTRSERIADKLRAHGLEPAALLKDAVGEQ